MPIVKYQGSGSIAANQDYVGNVSWYPGQERDVSLNLYKEYAKLSVYNPDWNAPVLVKDADIDQRSVVTSQINSATGRTTLRAAGADLLTVDNRTRYPAYFAKRPLQHVGVPYGTATINESLLTAGAVTRSVDTDTVFNGQPASKFTVTSGGSNPYIEVGTSGATITLDAEGQNLLNRKPLVAIKAGAGNTLSSATLYVGDGGYANFHTFSMSIVATVGDWHILAKPSPGASSTTGTPNLTAAVRAKLRVTMTANVAPGDVWVAPVYVLPQPKPSVVFTCDDGYAEWEWLAQQAYKRGVPISFGIAKDYIGSGGFLTETQMLSIANDYDGLFELTNHARVNSNFATLGLAEYTAHVEACRDYLVGLGCSEKAASLHQYVQGSFDQTLIDELKARGYLSAREVGASNRAAANLEIAMEGTGCNSLYKIPATCNLENTQNLSTVQGYITSSAYLGSAFIMGHRFAGAAATIQWVKGYDPSYGVLNLLDWLAEQRDSNGWNLRKWSDWHDDQLKSQLSLIL